MMRTWIAVAVLAASWMWGLDSFTGTNGWLWSVLLLSGVLMSAESPRRTPCRVDVLIAVLLALPTLWILQWPYRAIPFGFVLGLILLAMGNTPRWSEALGWGLVRSAAILAAQAVALRAYALLTSRCHDLP